VPKITEDTRDNLFVGFVGVVVDLCQRRALWVTCVAVMVTVFASIFLVNNIRIDTDTEEMLSSSLPFRQNTIALDKGFPQFDGLMLIVLDAPDPDAADDAAWKLVDEFRQVPDIFSNVFSLESDPFLRQHGLLYSEVEDLNVLSDRLIAAQPFLGVLWQQPNLDGLSNMLALLAKAEMADQETFNEAVSVLGTMASTAKNVRNGENAKVVWSDVLKGTKSAEKTARRLITLKPALNYGSLQPAEEAKDKIFEIVGKAGFLSEGYNVRITGSAALESDELESVEVGMGIAGIVSLVLVITLLLIGLRSFGAMIALLLTLVVGLIWTAAFAIFTLGALNLISVAFAVLFVGLSVDFGIHFVLRVSEYVDGQTGLSEALARGGRSVGPSLGVCTLTTAIAFFSFLPTAYSGLAELGFIAGAGMFVALVTNLTVLPAFMKLLVKRPPIFLPQNGGHSWANFEYSKKLASVIITGGVLSAVIAGYIAKDARFDFDPMNLKDKSAPSVETLFDLWSDGSLHPYSAEVLSGSIEDARLLGQKLLSLQEVKEIEGIDALIPSNQEEKFEIIDRLALFMGPAFFALQGDVAMTTSARDRALRQVSEQLSELEKSPVWSEVAGDLQSALRDLDEETAAKINLALFSGLPARLETLVSAFDADLIDIETLPDHLKSRYVTSKGMTRIEVIPSEDVRDQVALKEFVQAVQRVAPHAAGAPIVIIEAGQAVLASFAQALAYSLIGISIVLFVVLRRVKDVLLVFAPVLVAALWALAVSALLDIPFNFANVIVLPLLFGLSVDFGVHLVMRGRDGTKQNARSTTPRAITLSALTTIGSFGSIMLSGHPGTASMGLLLTISIALSLTAILILLPALMARAYRVQSY